METGPRRERPLHEQAEEFFRLVLTYTAPRPALQALHQLLQHSRERLQEPMRVAIVGLIKAGKSTLMNALLGEAIVPTGTVETTFNVNWLRFGDPPSLRVHFKDGRPPEPKAFTELQGLTRRADAQRTYLLSIQYVEVAYPNALLQTFNLIDTPGLESYYADDSQNTRDFLRVYGQELTAMTQAHASDADAVLYLFSQGIAATDQAILEEFQGPVVGQATPINAVGVLTKVDMYWADGHEPLEVGRKIARRLADHPQIRPLLYTIAPICGLLALGAQTLTSEEFALLRQLAALPPEQFERLTRTAERFSRREFADVPIPPSQRQRLLERLGQYGVGLAYTLLRDAGLQEQERLQTALLECSGVPQLRELIVAHFGNRAFLIKLNTVLQHLQVACFHEVKRQAGADLQAVQAVAGQVEAIQAQAYAFAELRVLRHYYDGKLNFTADEAEHLLAVTGEYGSSLGERLRVAAGERATIAEMLPVAEQRLRYWQSRAIDFLPDDTPETLDAVRVLIRSFERVRQRVQRVQADLYL